MKGLITFGTGLIMMSTISIAHEVIVKVSLSPAGSFEAKSAKVKGAVNRTPTGFSAENLWVKVEELKTGINLRDEHFHKHLNFEKFSKISFIQVTAANGSGSGTLVINDTKKVVPFTYKSINPKKIEATLKVKPSEFKLKAAKYMEVGVDDEVQIVTLIDV